MPNTRQIFILKKTHITAVFYQVDLIHTFKQLFLLNIFKFYSFYPGQIKLSSPFLEWSSEKGLSYRGLRQIPANSELIPRIWRGYRLTLRSIFPMVAKSRRLAYNAVSSGRQGEDPVIWKTSA